MTVRQKMALLQRRKDYLIYKIGTDSGTKGSVNRAKSELSALSFVLEQVLTAHPEWTPTRDDLPSIPIVRQVVI